MAKVSIVTFLVAALSVLVLTPLLYCQSPDNYPLPPGPPEGWRVPGRREPLIPAPPPPSGPESMANAPGQGNPQWNRPTAPVGEPFERYTGTRQFGGIAGTGITDYGTRPNR
jgi:hypothetical protein